MQQDKISGIGTYTCKTQADIDTWQRLAQFVDQSDVVFTRDTSFGGHITGSAFLLSPDRNAVLLTHHAKLDRWLQLGGHCDGIADVAFVALKEAYEESGLARIKLLSNEVLDVDIHEIPARGNEPAHLHYDVRYLMQAQSGEIQVSSESIALAWVPLATLQDTTQEPSILRMRDRVLATH